MGYFLEQAEKLERWKNLKDIPVPAQYSWIWGKFLQIWYNTERDFNGNVVFTYRAINDYVECMKVPLTVEDKKLLFKMKDWAFIQIHEMEKD